MSKYIMKIEIYDHYHVFAEEIYSEYLASRVRMQTGMKFNLKRGFFPCIFLI